MLPWVVWIVAAVFFFFNYMNQVVPSAMEGPLTKAFHIDATMLGTIAAVYFYIYAVMQIPVGVLVDHFGPHRSLGCAAVLAAAGCLLFSFVLHGRYGDCYSDDDRRRGQLFFYCQSETDYQLVPGKPVWHHDWFDQHRGNARSDRGGRVTDQPDPCYGDGDRRFCS